jgi:hypothetical protein
MLVQPVSPEQADREVPQGCHDLWSGAGADLGAVLIEGYAPHPVQLVLDAPVALNPLRKSCRGRGSGVGGGDEVDDLDGLLPLLVTVLRTWATWREPVNSTQAGTVTTLMVRVTRGPWPLSLALRAGTWDQGSALRRGELRLVLWGRDPRTGAAQSTPMGLPPNRPCRVSVFL